MSCLYIHKKSCHQAREQWYEEQCSVNLLRSQGGQLSPHNACHTREPEFNPLDPREKPVMHTCNLNTAGDQDQSRRILEFADQSSLLRQALGQWNPVSKNKVDRYLEDCHPRCTHALGAHIHTGFSLKLPHFLWISSSFLCLLSSGTQLNSTLLNRWKANFPSDILGSDQDWRLVCFLSIVLSLPPQIDVWALDFLIMSYKVYLRPV